MSGMSEEPVVRQTLPTVMSARAAHYKKRPRLSGPQSDIAVHAPGGEEVGHVKGHTGQATWREVDAETDYTIVISTVETTKSATTVRRAYQDTTSSHRAAISGLNGLSTSALTIDYELFSSLTFLIPAGMWAERDRAAFVERIVVSVEQDGPFGLLADLLSFVEGRLYRQLTSTPIREHPISWWLCQLRTNLSSQRDYPR